MQSPLNGFNVNTSIRKSDKLEQNRLDTIAVVVLTELQQKENDKKLTHLLLMSWRRQWREIESLAATKTLTSQYRSVTACDSRSVPASVTASVTERTPT